jgi:phosphodiesterase/alkaline phosphatase D-like protein
MYSKSPNACTSRFATKFWSNHGYNLLSYTLLLSFLSLVMFLTSTINTAFNYNTKPYRDWALAGGVTSTSANFRIRGPSHDEGIRREFVLSNNPNLAIEKDQILVTPVSYEDFTPQEHFVKRVSIDSLSPMTTYYYGITHPQSIPNSAKMAGDVGKFTTPPSEGNRVNFTIATGSCALTGSRSQMFSSALELNPSMFIHMGDFHYEDLDTTNVDERLAAYDKVMGSQAQRLLYMRTIFTYIWDDHDWLGNNRDSSDAQAGNVAKEGYSLGIPHYELGAVQNGSNVEEDTAAKYQAFTIGSVRFIISDLRSESIKSSESFGGQVYSAEQKEWLYNELSQATNYDFVVWVTSRPWTNPDKIGSDSWGGFVNDRDELAYYIASTIGAGSKNLFVLSGDNHMVAFDDGSSTDYSNQNQVSTATEV